MVSYDVYSIIGGIHVVGFIIYMAIVKFGFKKSVTEKMIGYYVLAWLVGLLIFSITVASIYDIPISIAAILGEFIVLGLAFLIVDGIAWYLGKLVYKKSSRKQ